MSIKFGDFVWCGLKGEGRGGGKCEVWCVSYSPKAVEVNVTSSVKKYHILDKIYMFDKLWWEGVFKKKL